MSRGYTNAFRITAIPIVLLLTISIVQSVELAHAQNSSASNASASNSTKTNATSAGNKTVVMVQISPTKHTSSPVYNRTGFKSLYVLPINGKTYPIKYSIVGGKAVGLLADTDRTTLVAVLNPSATGGNMTIEIPRHMMDSKGASNTDTKYLIKIDGKGVDYKEVANNANARVLSIDFSKDNRFVEIIGTQMTH